MGNSEHYEGAKREGLKHGKGKQTIKKCTYVGEFQYDKRTGYGVLTCKNGYKYEGEWLEDKMHGKGELTDKNGDNYKG